MSSIGGPGGRSRVTREDVEGPGRRLRFTTRENQITGMSLAAEPAGSLKVERKAIESRRPARSAA
jgi:hypothetical protein